MKFEIIVESDLDCMKCKINGHIHYTDDSTAAICRSISILNSTLDEFNKSISSRLDKIDKNLKRLSGDRDGIDDITHQLYHLVEEITRNNGGLTIQS